MTRSLGQQERSVTSYLQAHGANRFLRAQITVFTRNLPPPPRNRLMPRIQPDKH